MEQVSLLVASTTAWVSRVLVVRGLEFQERQGVLWDCWARTSSLRHVFAMAAAVPLDTSPDRNRFNGT